MPESQKVGRLALREEGNWWKAYYAMPDTMKGAILLGQIHMKFVVDRPERKNSFVSLMRAAVGDIIEEAFGDRPTWPEGLHPAPEHERKP